MAVPFNRTLTPPSDTGQDGSAITVRPPARLAPQTVSNAPAAIPEVKDAPFCTARSTGAVLPPRTVALTEGAPFNSRRNWLAAAGPGVQRKDADPPASATASAGSTVPPAEAAAKMWEPG